MTEHAARRIVLFSVFLFVFDRFMNSFVQNFGVVKRKVQRVMFSCFGYESGG